MMGEVTRLVRTGLQREYRALLAQQLRGVVATAEALERQEPGSDAADVLRHVKLALVALHRGIE